VYFFKVGEQLVKIVESGIAALQVVPEVGFHFRQI